MLCGLFMLIDGNATLRVTCQLAPLTAETVPGFVLPDVVSNCVATQTSPTAGVAGFCSGASVRSLPYRALRTAGRFTTPMSTRTSTFGWVMCHGAPDA